MWRWGEGAGESRGDEEKDEMEDNRVSNPDSATARGHAHSACRAVVVTSLRRGSMLARSRGVSAVLLRNPGNLSGATFADSQ